MKTRVRLKEASRKKILRQQREHWEKRGGLPKVATRRNRVVCRGLTYDQAAKHLERIANRLAVSMDTAQGQFFLIGWPRVSPGEEGTGCGFPVELWITEPTRMEDYTDGLFDIVERSTPLYQLPWLNGLGWAVKK